MDVSCNHPKVLTINPVGFYGKENIKQQNQKTFDEKVWIFSGFLN